MNAFKTAIGIVLGGVLLVGGKAALDGYINLGYLRELEKHPEITIKGKVLEENYRDGKFLSREKYTVTIVPNEGGRAVVVFYEGISKQDINYLNALFSRGDTVQVLARKKSSDNLIGIEGKLVP